VQRFVGGRVARGDLHHKERGLGLIPTARRQSPIIVVSSVPYCAALSTLDSP
jgi:hypothetical protein